VRAERGAERGTARGGHPLARHVGPAALRAAATRTRPR
jgi:hypothetical protein